MGNIVGIIDMDGFQKKFLCKEFAVSGKKARSFLFDLGIKFEKTWKS